MVLPGLTRASSSFTITSNHQNILPLWPAAPPPGQPVVFFCPLSGGPPVYHVLSGGMVCPEGQGMLVPGTCGPLCQILPSCPGLWWRGSSSGQAAGGQGRASLRGWGLHTRCTTGFGRPGPHRFRSSCTLRPLFRRMAVTRTVTAGTACPSRQEPLSSFFLYQGRCLPCPPGVDRSQRQCRHGPHRPRQPCGTKKTSTGMETGGRLVLFQGCGAQDQNSL